MSKKLKPYQKVMKKQIKNELKSELKSEFEVNQYLTSYVPVTQPTGKTDNKNSFFSVGIVSSIMFMITLISIILLYRIKSGIVIEQVKALGAEKEFIRSVTIESFPFNETLLGLEIFEILFILLIFFVLCSIVCFFLNLLKNK